MPFQGPYNTDWIYATASNVHVANHRDWFSKYTPFPSRTEVPNGAGMEVLGIGDVQLEVNMKHDVKRGGAFHSLVLRDVLYVPDAVTNVVAALDLDDFTQCSFGGNGSITNPATGVTLLLDKPRLYKLWLVGQPLGQTSLDPSKEYWINVSWSIEERARWETHKLLGGRGFATAMGDGHKRTHNAVQSTATGASQKGKDGTGAKSKKRNKKRRKGQNAANLQAQDDPHVLQEQNSRPAPQDSQGANASDAANGRPPRYSPEEKAWLKKNYGNEFKFLRAHGLKIYKESDRQLGEDIMRGMMATEASGNSNRAGSPADESDGLSPDEPGRPYTKAERKWLHNGYGGEKAFLRRSGLDMNNQRDRDEGRKLVRAMMRDDGSADEPWMLDIGRAERDAIMDAIIYGTPLY